MLRLKTFIPPAAAMLALLPLSAHAAALTVVNVNAPAVNCVFATNCINVVTDSIGNFTPPFDAGVARLQSRTTPGIPPAPAGGKMAYEYRVDLTAVHGITAVNCVTKLTINFGPVVPEPYPPGALKQVWVTTSGGLGSVGIASANQSGSVITFTFGAGGVCPGQTSYFFGLTSASTTPHPGVATLTYSLPGPATGTTPDRVP
jgi:hypothetical protein